MPQPLSDMLTEIIAAVCKSSDFDMSLNKTKVYNKVVSELEKIDYMPRTPAFVRNMLTGAQGASKATRRTVDRLHARLAKPKPVRSTQNIKVRCTPERATEYRDAFTTQERARILDEAMKERVK